MIVAAGGPVTAGLVNGSPAGGKAQVVAYTVP